MSDNLEAVLSNTEVNYFYNGEVKLVYDAKAHTYSEEIDGVKYLVGGCTTVLSVLDKPALLPWAAKMVVTLLRDRLVGVEADGVTPAVNFSHIYTVEALDKLLLEAKSNYRNISQEAKDTGHLAHDWLEQNTKAILRGEVCTDPLPDDPMAQNCIKAALSWQEKHNFRPVFAERKFYSRHLGVAGTADWGALIDSCDDPKCCPAPFNNKKALGDYKSSKALYEEYKLQTAFYAAAHCEETPSDPFDCRVILRLGKSDGDFEALVLSDPEEYAADLAAFAACAEIYAWKQQPIYDRRYEKAVERAAKARSKPAKKPRRVKIKEVTIEEEGDIPVAA